MTTTSAGNGPSAGDGRRDDDSGWGWFTRSRPATEAAASQEQDQHDQQDEQRQRTQRGPEQNRQPGGQNEQRGPARRPVGDGGWTVRPLSPIVDGTGAGRARWAETPEEAAEPVPAPPDPYAAGTGPARTGEEERGAPAPGAWYGGGPEAPREHPAPAQYGGNGTAAPAAAPRPQSPPHSPPPGPGRTPPASRPQAERQPQPRSAPDPYEAAPAPPPAPPPAQAAGPEDAELIRRTLEEVEPRADAATAYFYALLFVQQPQLRDLFPASMDSQRDRLFRALLTAVQLADEADALSEYLSGLGRGHRKYGTLPEHYPAVGECLLGALAQYAPKSWSPETEQAWVRAYTTISQVMIDAAAEDAQRAPAWWNAEVVSHELRTSEIAVITLRPDQPYPFLAGQYTSVETPWWPRVWRHYSFASSPRSDGLLTFHVKAVPTGWVSSALVNRARPGDVLRLGPPAGNMTVDHDTDSGMLCVGGGTGIAPIRALVEDVAQHGRSRPVEVFYGARSDHDLYDLDTMMRLEREHRWLSVRPVVATPPGSAFANALAGQLPDAVRQHGPWSAYDGYLSGPPGLIRSGVDALVASGVPAERIRHDSLAELILSGERTSG
ncbi:globin domain-containing protein [Streptomyces sp. WMMB 322]|uniref:globin domain-containing protein n=1 Tax=Streptomyces sp. WMMB 322 TaxID=1286821 RepID=UPI0006E23851|nr:globin domain-containing protein [Streptomyces sp. WMMB 322]SCK14405.1 NAD(P)H-flavin reductase [Streptomyces sp. WMMB 322]